MRAARAPYRELRLDPSVEVRSGELGARLAVLTQEPGAEVWLCGGGEVAAQLLGEIDEIAPPAQPVMLGSGVPLFASGGVRRRHVAGAEEPPGGVGLRRCLPEE